MNTVDLIERYARLKNAQAHDSALIAVLASLEADIVNLKTMTHVLARLLEDSLREYRDGEWIECPRNGGFLAVQLYANDCEVLSFAWNDVLNRANALEKKFLEAFQEPVIVSEAAE